MIVNPDKCNYMCMDENSNDSDILIWNKFILKNSDEVIIPGITIDQILSFGRLTKHLCKIANQKSRALDESEKETHILLNDQISIKLPQSSLNVLFRTNNLIIKVRERALRSIIMDNKVVFSQFIHLVRTQNFPKN